MEPKYKTGDPVRIINYGHPVKISRQEQQRMHSCGLSGEKPGNLLSENDKEYWFDQMPSIVGMRGTIKIVSKTPQNDIPIYTIDGIKGKSAWYEEQQLESYEQGEGNKISPNNSSNEGDGSNV